MPASSAIFAKRRLSGQVPDQRSGTLVTARPEEQLAPNRPIFSAWPPASRLRCGNDEFAIGTIIPQAWLGPHYRTLASLATPIRTKFLGGRVMALNWIDRGLAGVAALAAASS